MYEWTDEQKKTLFDEPKLKPDSEYPDWLWTEDFLTDINSINIESIEPGTDLYWKKVRFLQLSFQIIHFRLVRGARKAVQRPLLRLARGIPRESTTTASRVRIQEPLSKCTNQAEIKVSQEQNYQICSLRQSINLNYYSKHLLIFPL